MGNRDAESAPQPDAERSELAFSAVDMAPKRFVSPVRSWIAMFTFTTPAMASLATSGQAMSLKALHSPGKREASEWLEAAFSGQEPPARNLD